MLRNAALPQSIQIYLPQGDPAGIRMAEITTRTVRVFEVPRPLLRDFREMPESKQVGVYFLLGSSPSGSASCYIGQSGSLGDRLKQHSDEKDFWDHALVAVSLANTWTNTHTGYMEWTAIKRATEAGRYELHNSNDASNPHTPAPLESDCREYLETISVLLTTLGYPVLEPVREIRLAGPDSNGAAETLVFREGGTEARPGQRSKDSLSWLVPWARQPPGHLCPPLWCVGARTSSNRVSSRSAAMTTSS